MSDQRVTVWVQRFKDRSALMLQWIDPYTGRRKSKSAGTADEKEADAKRVDLESDLNNGRYHEASRMTWERFRELFEVEFLPGRRENTQRNYRVALDLFERLCHPTQLRSVSERTVSGFAAALRKEPGRRRGSTGMMQSTVKVRLQFLHTALQWAADQGLLPKCPRFQPVKVPEKSPQPVPTEAFEKLLDKAPDPQTRAYVLAGWLGGLRLAEALALEWEENEKAPYLDLAANRVVLPAEFCKGTRDQWVPLDPDLRAALMALPRTGAKVFRFLGRRGNVLGPGAVSQRVQALAKRAGVRLTMKSLRRGFGCSYAAKVSAHVLQKLMRHRNIKTTMDYYANVDEAVEEAVRPGRRNSLCNIPTQLAGRPDAGPDVNHLPSTTNSRPAG
jgi:integrase